MKEFMKAWIIAFIRLFGVLISIATIAGIFFGVIYWLDKFGVIGYIGIGIWVLIWVSAIVTYSDYSNKKKG